MNDQNKLWYWKKGGKVNGPFPSGLLQQYIILGRVKPDDLMSQDKQTWQRAATIRDLIPDVVRHKNDPNYEERLEAARRWADDRGDSRDSTGDKKKRNTHLGIKILGWKGILLVTILVASAIWTAFYFTPEKSFMEVDCKAAPKPGVIYDGCDLQGRNFSNKDLSKASFRNANLNGADLSGAILVESKMQYSDMSLTRLAKTNFKKANLTAVKLSGAIINGTDFRGADLSFANLTKAKARKIRLKKTRLSKTVWFNGQVCAEQSVDKCLIAK